MGHLASKLQMKPSLDLLSGILSSSLGKHAGKMSNISLSRFELYCNEGLVLREPKMFEDQSCNGYKMSYLILNLSAGTL